MNYEQVVNKLVTLASGAANTYFINDGHNLFLLEKSLTKYSKIVSHYLEGVRKFGKNKIGKKGKKAIQFVYSKMLLDEPYYLLIEGEWQVGIIVTKVSDETRAKIPVSEVTEKISTFKGLMGFDPKLADHGLSMFVQERNDIVAGLVIQGQKVWITFHAFERFLENMPMSSDPKYHGYSFPQREFLLLLCRFLKNSNLMIRSNKLNQLIKYGGQKAIYRSRNKWIYVLVWDFDHEAWVLTTCYDKQYKLSDFGFKASPLGSSKDSWLREVAY